MSFEHHNKIALMFITVLVLMLGSCDRLGFDGQSFLGIENEHPDYREIQFKKTEKAGDFKAEVVPKPMTVLQKKKRFKALLVPPVQKVYVELDRRYQQIDFWLKEGTHAEEIAALKEEYKAESDHELLAALKPHPPSIVLAQAAMESAWGTSRFFVKAKNVFGVWSFDDEEPRIAAGNQRDGETIWVKKYDSIEDSVRDNYRVLARGFAHQHFRDARLQTNDPFKLVKKLDRYSEMGAKYGDELASVIRHNHFTDYDPVPKPKAVVGSVAASEKKE